MNGARRGFWLVKDCLEAAGEDVSQLGFEALVFSGAADLGAVGVEEHADGGGELRLGEFLRACAIKGRGSRCGRGRGGGIRRCRGGR